MSNDLPRDYFRVNGTIYRIQNLSDFRAINKDLLKKMKSQRGKRTRQTTADQGGGLDLKLGQDL